MTQIFVDSGGFFAYLNPSDANHVDARNLFRQATVRRWRLVTTNAVVYETHALLLARIVSGDLMATAFLSELGRGLAHVERVTSADDQRAIGWLRLHVGEGHSFCDALSFVVMDRLHCRHAIAFDAHFAKRALKP